MANHHRKQHHIPIIGITGSNGKTTCKELLHAVLSQKYHTHYTKGNLNNHIGVPLTLLELQENHEMAIIEMGASGLKEIEELCLIAEPNYGVITNIGTAHIEGFGSKEGVKITKNELYVAVKQHNGIVFTNNDDPILKELTVEMNKVTYGKSSADCTADLLEEVPTLSIKWNNLEINSSLYGTYNFYNILLAICVGHHFDVTPSSIKAGVEGYHSTNNRSQLIESHGKNIYLDAYNANPSSMLAAIESFNQQVNGQGIAIVGDMLELGNISKSEHQAIADKLHSFGLDAILVGKEFGAIDNKHDFNHFDNAKDVINSLNRTPLTESNILIKGSRGIRLETVADHLQKKDA